MKKIKFLFIAMAAMLTSATFTACSSDDNNDVVNNPATYQDQVDQIVKDGKKHNKVILLVAFGSTWQQAYDAFDETVKKYKNNPKFSNYDVFLSFSSAICINRAYAAENTDSRSFYEPRYWLEAFGRVQYQEIVVQSMQVIPGEEFSRVVNAMKDFANNSNGDLDVNYMAKFAFDEETGEPGENQLKLGLPLMHTGWAADEAYDPTAENDVNKLADALHTNFGKWVAAGSDQGYMLFMGHGNPDPYDTYKANIRYTQLETALQHKSNRYFVGTVDMANNFKVQVWKRMKTQNFTNGNVYCAPLMSIAGDHAHNDMADDEDEESWFSMFNAAGIETAAYETTFKEACLKGYTTGTDYIPALAERSAVRKLWMNHTKEAIGKLGTEDALSTPTTAPDEE